MTPTPTVLLLVALFWTLPASAAAMIYRGRSGSIEKIEASAGRLFGRWEFQPQPDA